MRLSILLFLVTTLSLDAQMIRGRVVDADAKPVAGAQVQVVLAERSTLDFIHSPAAKTDEDGRYQIDSPAFGERERATLAVTLPAHATVRSKPFATPLDNLTVDVTLPRFETVTVRVADRKGKPLPKARVAFAPSEETVSLRGPAMLLMEHYGSRHTETNDAGDAVLHLVPGLWDFAAVAENFQPGTLPEREISPLTLPSPPLAGERVGVRGTSLAIALEPAVTIKGRVHRGDTGVANAHVYILEGERRTRDHRLIVTDKDGAFEIRGLSPAPYRIAIVKEAEMVRRIVETKAPSNLDIDLPPAGTLRLRVIDGRTQEPVREFMYSIEALDQPESNMLQSGRTDDDGMVSSTLPAGTYRVSATAQGYTLAKPVDVRVTEREPEEITIALDRGITIGGRVLDENNDPVGDAAIFFEGSDDRARRIGPANTRSAADGTFTISGIEPGTMSVVVRRDGFVPFRKPMTFDASTTVDIQLASGLMLEGIVRRGGKPARDVQIDATTAGRGGDQQTSKTDANGRFVLRGLVAARYTISAYTNDTNAQLNDVDPTRTREVVLSLDPKPTGILHGIVTGIPTNLGGKITRRVVFVQSADRGVEGMIDEAGNYRIEDAPAGTVFVTAQFESTLAGRSSQRKTVEVVPGESVRVDLDLGGAHIVRGRVTHDGQAARGVRVVFANATGLAGSASSRADGTYEVALPAPGSYQVIAHSEMYERVNVHLVREIRGGETIDIELREQTIEGTVVDAVTRSPLPDIRVTLVSASGQSFAGEVITDRNGRFRLPTAAVGSYRIIAWARGYSPHSEVIQLGSARPPQLTFELAKTDGLRVRVLDARSGTPLGANMAVSNLDGTLLPVNCDLHEDGVSYLCSVAPGKYRLAVMAQGYADRQVEVTAPGTVDVLME